VATTDQKPTTAPSKQRRADLIILGIVAVLALSAFGLWRGLQTKSTTHASQAPIAKVSPTPSASPTAETVSTDINIGFTPTRAASGQTVSASLSLTAPLNWRTQIQSTDDEIFCNPSTSDQRCFSFTFANMLGSPTSLRAANSITLFNLSGWKNFNGDAPDQVADFGGTTDAAKKQQLITATEALTPITQLTPDSLNSLFNPFITNAGFTGRSDVQFIQSSDGKLKGYSFIASLVQNPAYIPQTFAVLIGEDNGATIALGGEFSLNDEQRKSNPSASGTFFNSYTDRYKYGSDTTAQNDQALAVMRSIRLSS
jgi:hypothetical protein